MTVKELRDILNQCDDNDEVRMVAYYTDLYESDEIGGVTGIKTYTDTGFSEIVVIYCK